VVTWALVANRAVDVLWVAVPDDWTRPDDIHPLLDGRQLGKTTRRSAYKALVMVGLIESSGNRWRKVAATIDDRIPRLRLAHKIYIDEKDKLKAEPRNAVDAWQRVRSL
jgi:hypothetical protein